MANSAHVQFSGNRPWQVTPVLVLTALLALGMALVASPARAADAVASYTAQSTINPDGSIDVTATITPGEATPAEITQEFNLREELVDLRHAHYEMSEVAVTADGAPAGEVREDRFGTTVTMHPQAGQPIELTYTVTGAAAEDEAGATEVQWNPLQGLSVGVQEFEGTLVIPGMFQDFKCVAGPPGTDSSCAAAQGFPQESPQPTYVDGPRGAGEVVGFRMVFDAATVAPNAQVEDQWTFGRAFRATGWPLVVALVVLVAGAAVVIALYRRRGVDATAGDNIIKVAEFRAAGKDQTEFVVNGELRPGQIGTLVDERVDPVDVTASILDLAVRGHLRIHELPRERRFAGGDWEIERRHDGDESSLRPYEAALLKALTPETGRIKVSEIQQVAGAIPEVQSLLYEEMVAKGWYERRPDDTRNRWTTIAIAALLIGLVGTALLAAFTPFGLTGIALILVGLGLAWAGTEMPARTPKGASILQGLAVLSGELRSQATNQMPPGREYEELSEVLPYAVVLGGRDRWLNALVAADDDEDADSTDLDWYHGPADWHLRDLPDSLHNLVIHLEGHLFSR